MVSAVSLRSIYTEIKSRRKDVEAVKEAIIPEERVSFKEMKELRKIAKEMEAGREKSFKEIFG